MNAKGSKGIKVALAVVLVATLAGCREKRNVRASTYTYLDAPFAGTEVYESPIPAPSVAPAAGPETVATPGVGLPEAAPLPEPAPIPQGAPLPAASAWPGDDQPELTAEGIEPLTRGPVHEAFAEPTTGAAEAPLVVKRQAPPDVPEVPPEEKPAGDNVIWIPGYWGWDTDRQDFIWVSGLWRAIPPGMRWIGGYWTPTLGGWRWVSGFWVAAAAQQIQYVSAAPPEPVYEEPIGAAPSEDSYWAPGCWIYVSTTHRYGWRHGFWVTGRSDWCWVPAHWIWTPRGCVFVDGYWDHCLDRRGMLFAPVFFTRPVYRQPRFVFCPTIAINITVLPHHLFVRTGDRHYVFGDYYAARNRKAGIVPLVEFQARRGAFDPIFAQEKWSHRKDDPRWGDTERKRYESLRDNKAPRPAATFAVQQEQSKAAQRTALKPAAVPTAIPPMLARPVRDVAADKTAALRVEKITPAAREDFLKKSRDLSSSIVTRSRVETGLLPAKTEGPTLGPTAPKIAPVAPASPIGKPATPVAPVKPAPAGTPASRDTRPPRGPTDGKATGVGPTTPPARPGVTIPGSKPVEPKGPVDTKSPLGPKTVTEANAAPIHRAPPDLPKGPDGRGGRDRPTTDHSVNMPDLKPAPAAPPQELPRSLATPPKPPTLSPATPPAATEPPRAAAPSPARMAAPPTSPPLKRTIPAPAIGTAAAPPPAVNKSNTPTPAPVKVAAPAPPAAVELPPKPIARALPPPAETPDVAPVRTAAPTPAPAPTRATPVEPLKTTPVERPMPPRIESPRPAPVETPRPAASPVERPAPAPPPPPPPPPAPASAATPAPAPTPTHGGSETGTSNDSKEKTAAGPRGR